jgi:tellurite methyltransferase
MEHGNDVPGFTRERLARYLERNVTLPVRDTLLRALKHAGSPGSAADLGCGPGKEVAELLRRGWRVEAVDAYREMTVAARAAAEAAVGPAECDARLRCTHVPLAAWDAGCGQLDLVHAGFSLPFVAVADFPALWERVVRAIRPGGLFAGQLFGPNDGFLRESPAGSMNAHARDAVDRLLAPFDVLSIAEEERDGVIGAPPNERVKHWHVFHIVARRRA